MGTGEWEDFECPICKGKAKRSELEAGFPPLYKYICKSCKEFAIDMNTENQKEDLIREHWELISAYMSGFSASHDRTLIIVTANPLEEHEMTIEQILEIVKRQSEDETVNHLSEDLNGL
jgi:hypothetical protein